ncbi:hypothetical protein B0J15DRAFT_409457 [Fusarium solani]|uniref:NodB homology domain-containing protein n=1 Tax=Fusarium solani TaxID=169388 RepID=A0A9P9JTW1_FUSSL|nr:uncharacterized protein B0J15DRAFT_409457 [Fusarium solani]KAH7232005.1 hypothetical protein B0J15DRAFT_409457 [Fusarium solani]
MDWCTMPGVVSLTFNEGPTQYTAAILNKLNAAGMKATFFVNGLNHGSIHDHASIIQRIVNEGHQLASLGWRYLDLTQQTPIEIQDNMIKLEDALISIANVQPSYMRPPYLRYNTESMRVLGDLGYATIFSSITVDDEDLQQNPHQAINNFVNGLNAGGTIALLHDTHPKMVDDMLPAIISAIQARGMRGVTVGECFGIPSSSWHPINL